jgi:hypothetical protein
MTRLAVNPILQPPDECALASVAMVLSYMGYQAKIEQLQRFVPSDSPKWRDWLLWLGAGVQQLGGACDLVSLSTQVFDLSWQGLNKKRLIALLEKELRFISNAARRNMPPQPGYFSEHLPRVEVPEIRAAIKFLKLGGRILLRPTTVSLIESYLKKRKPVIASVDATMLYRIARNPRNKVDNGTGTTWGHVVVVVGFSKSSFVVVDPTDWFAKKQYFSVPKPYLIEAITRRDQNILVVNKAPTGEPVGGR